MIRIEILSRATDIKRRDSISEQLSQLDGMVFYNFFDAITPSYLPENIIKSDSLLTGGEKCCALGHILMCKMLIDSNEQYRVFMEDDANVDLEKFKEIEPALKFFHKKFDVIVLGYSKVDEELKNKIQFFRPLFRVLRYKNYNIGIPYKNWKCGTVCYSISKKGARKLVKINADCLYTSDDWNQFAKNGLKIAHLMPLAVTEQYAKFTSSLESERKTFKQRALLLRYGAGLFRHISCFIEYIKYKIFTS
ncbi:glycosyltransferase family 25 protein [Aeromonas veronii]|uniref:glycosyltransferase family 25 protein n=1 Tax=Aeromonas veronii TaxID=654 RepID=UPI00192010D2|nr:glycosyltransferase family 25 protein [Aeromonas veronii]MBL0443869.1 glycosyltransferase family 25 protein [Aeromonas veronii]